MSFLHADLEQPGIGLTAEDAGLICDAGLIEVWHLAAEVSFEQRHRARVLAANLMGTINLISALRSLQGNTIRCFNFISTAYVCGYPINELPAAEELTKVSKFRCPYEESKQAAEWVVAGSGFPYRILRPSAIVGHSSTGESDNKTIYAVLKILSSLKKRMNSKGNHHPHKAVIGLNPEARLNCICVDDVVRAMVGLRDCHSFDKVFHLVNLQTATMSEIFSNAGQLAGLEMEFATECDLGLARQLSASLPPEEIKPEDTELLESQDLLVNKLLFQYMPYMHHSDPLFETTNICAALPNYQPSQVDGKKLHWLYAKHIENGS